MEIIQKVRETIIRHFMLSENDHLLIGLSGGPDSVCLAIVIDKLRPDFNLSLSALYIDHGLRPDEIEGEIRFCEKFCNRYGINFHKRQADVKGFAKDRGMNLQESARELRYEIFEETAINIKADKIALGHTADDQAETVLMRLFRGSGRKGLTGIPPVRGGIIRPLIDIEKDEIERFLNDDLSEQFIVDSSNLKEHYTRNWIRLSLMGEIKERYPTVARDICRTAEIFREEEAYLDIVVTKTLMRMISRKSDPSIELFLNPLGTTEKPILRRLLRRAIDATKGLRGIGFVHIEDIIKLIKKGTAGDRLNLPDGIRVIRDYSLLKITTERPVRISEYEIQPPDRIIIRETSMALTTSLEEGGGGDNGERWSVLLDAGGMSFPLRIRARAAGDFFYPLGFGKRKKLQDFFVDEKIPRDERDKVPIVLSGNDIIWVAGLRADERFRVTDKTEKFLRLTISKG